MPRRLKQEPITAPLGVQPERDGVLQCLECGVRSEESLSMFGGSTASTLMITGVIMSYRGLLRCGHRS